MHEALAMKSCTSQKERCSRFLSLISHLKKCRHFRYQLREGESLWFEHWNLMFSSLHCFYHFRYPNKESLCCSSAIENGPELSCGSFSWQLRRRKYQLFSHRKCPKPGFKAVSRGCKSCSSLHLTPKICTVTRLYNPAVTPFSQGRQICLESVLCHQTCSGAKQ